MTERILWLFRTMKCLLPPGTVQFCSVTHLDLFEEIVKPRFRLPTHSLCVHLSGLLHVRTDLIRVLDMRLEHLRG